MKFSLQQWFFSFLEDKLGIASRKPPSLRDDGIASFGRKESFISF